MSLTSRSTFYTEISHTHVEHMFFYCTFFRTKIDQIGSDQIRYLDTSIDNDRCKLHKLRFSLTDGASIVARRLWRCPRHTLRGSSANAAAPLRRRPAVEFSPGKLWKTMEKWENHRKNHMKMHIYPLVGV